MTTKKDISNGVKKHKFSARPARFAVSETKAGGGGSAFGGKETKKPPHQNPARKQASYGAGKFGTPVVEQSSLRGAAGQADRAREELKDLEDLPLVGGLFKGLEKFIDLAGRVEEAGGGIERKGEIKGKEGVKGIYGFSIRTGIGERPRIQTFGNIRPVKEKAKPPHQTPARKQASYGAGKFGTGQAKIKITEEREPIVDVFNEKDYVLIVAELPGVNEKEIETTLKGDILILEAGEAVEGERKYYKEILLPAEVDIRTKKVSYKNGLLEVKIKKS